MRPSPAQDHFRDEGRERTTAPTPPAPAAGAHAQLALTLQRGPGNRIASATLGRAGRRVVQRWKLFDDEERTLDPAVRAYYVVGKAKPKEFSVRLASKVKTEAQAESIEVGKILDQIVALGFGFDSPGAKEREREDFKDKKQARKVRVESWTVDELRAFLFAVQRLGPSLPKEDKHGTLGKISTPKTRDERHTLAHTVRAAKAITFKTGGERHKEQAFGDVATTLKATALHELTHLFFDKKGQGQYIALTKYWRAEKGNKGDWLPLPKAEQVEQPVSAYGKDSPDEDYSEAVSWFFIKGSAMKGTHPLRFAAIQQLIPEAAAALLEEEKTKQAATQSAPAEEKEREPEQPAAVVNPPTTVVTEALEPELVL